MCNKYLCTTFAEGQMFFFRRVFSEIQIDCDRFTLICTILYKMHMVSSILQRSYSINGHEMNEYLRYYDHVCDSACWSNISYLVNTSLPL